MPRFYFDFDDDGGTVVDNDGDEYPSIEAAKREAFAALGDAAKDYASARDPSNQRLIIRLRDKAGAILEVSAAFESKLIRR
jgi:hypothetical protein